MRDDIKFHAERAMAELDQAIRAASVPAARAHFTLSALHLEKMQALGCDVEQTVAASQS